MINRKVLSNLIVCRANQISGSINYNRTLIEEDKEVLWKAKSSHASGVKSKCLLCQTCARHA